MRTMAILGLYDFITERTARGSAAERPLRGCCVACFGHLKPKVLGSGKRGTCNM